MEESGYPYDQVPWHNWTGHMDGLWSGGGAILQARACRLHWPASL